MYLALQALGVQTMLVLPQQVLSGLRQEPIRLEILEMPPQNPFLEPGLTGHGQLVPG